MTPRTAWGMLLLAASLSAQPKPEPRSAAMLPALTLDETQAQVAALYGQPHQVAPSGPNHVAWQYYLGHDQHDPSHFFLFRRTDGRLVSVTRNADQEEPVTALFPNDQTATAVFAEAGKPRYQARVRVLSKDRVLIAMGASRPDQPVRQLILIRRSELRSFLPWIERHLEGTAKD